jgi:SAM-dependent methyltransferase
LYKVEEDVDISCYRRGEGMIIIKKILKKLFKKKLFPDLTGDRELEWSFVAARIGKYVERNSKVLDFGCGSGFLSFVATSIGANTLAIDLMPTRFNVDIANLNFQKIDLLGLENYDRYFDLIINCSTVEHVGLSGRYNSQDMQDGDLRAMAKLSQLLKPNGHMLLTIPVGQDDVKMPLHRIYGPKRLPKLLGGFLVVEGSYWKKNQRNIWFACGKEEAMKEKGSDYYYAIGCMDLKIS